MMSSCMARGAGPGRWLGSGPAPWERVGVPVNEKGAVVYVNATPSESQISDFFKLKNPQMRFA